MVTTPFEPTWKEHEKDLHSDNPETAKLAGEAFDKTRKQETEFSAKAKKWEKDRKKELADNKPLYIKKQLEKEEDVVKQVGRDIKDFGTLNYNLRPYNGFVLIKIIYQEDTTTGGIVLPDSAVDKNEIAEVIKVGEPLQLSAKVLVKAGVEAGDRVLLKKFAGVDVTLKGVPHKLCQFSDMLGILE